MLTRATCTPSDTKHARALTDQRPIFMNNSLVNLEKMEEEIKSQILKFERYVDQILVSQEIFQYDPFECIELVGGIVEEVWLSHIYEWFGGLNILVPLRARITYNAVAERANKEKFNFISPLQA